MSSVTLLSINSIPEEVLRYALKHLKASELAALSSTCKYFYKVADESVKDILFMIQKAKFPISLKLYSMPNINYNLASSNLKRLLHKFTSTQIYTIGGAFNSEQVNCLLPSESKADCEWYSSSDCQNERERSAVTSVFGYIITVSGETDSLTSSTVEIFSPYENVWVNLPSLPVKIRQTACVTIGDNLVTVGGCDQNQLPTSSIYLLDLKISTSTIKNIVWNPTLLDSTSWKSQECVLLESRYGHSVTSYRDEIIVAGGSTVSDPYSSSVESLIYENGKLRHCRKLADMKHGRSHFQLHVVQDRLYAVGGDHQDESVSIECYNDENDEWEIISTFPTYRQNFSSTCDNESIFVFGGQSRRRVFLSSWDSYNVISNSWNIQNAKMPADEGFAFGSAVTFPFSNLTWT